MVCSFVSIHVSCARTCATLRQRARESRCDDQHTHRNAATHGLPHMCVCCVVALSVDSRAGGTGGRPPVASLLALPRSLLVFQDEAYTHCLHGIEEVCAKGWGVGGGARGGWSGLNWSTVGAFIPVCRKQRV